MRESFYTCGGSHFWEDVFFYQKWRIQRNHVTKKCRLLDNWDIRRHEGSFEECRRAFVKYIEAYEIARQKGHMIIMLHSLGESKNIFKPLWRRALKKGFLVAAVNYPSTQKDLASHIKQLRFFLDHLEDVHTVSFVAHGAGCAVLQGIFAEKAEWQKRLKLGRSVFVSPYIYGSKLFAKLSSNYITGFLIGPMGNDLTIEKISKFPPLTAIENGIVITQRSLTERFLEFVTWAWNPKKTKEEILEYTKAVDLIEIKRRRWSIFKDKKLCDTIINFLKNGKF